MTVTAALISPGEGLFAVEAYSSLGKIGAKDNMNSLQGQMAHLGQRPSADWGLLGSYRGVAA